MISSDTWLVWQNILLYVEQNWICMILYVFNLLIWFLSGCDHELPGLAWIIQYTALVGEGSVAVLVEPGFY
jgi:hypothetical protein